MSAIIEIRKVNCKYFTKKFDSDNFSLILFDKELKELMSFRIEEKLYIEKVNLIQFREQLKIKSCQKVYHPRVIESLYFDNMNLDMYTDSIEGITPRKKIRVRRYPEDNDKKLYFEIKNSSVEGRFKTRKIINTSDFEIKNLQEFWIPNMECFPMIFVRYKREYLVIGDVRISIDKRNSIF